MKKTSNIVVESPIDGISRIKLNEPSTYNALSSKMLESLINIFKSLNKENETKVIIIEGSGNGFSGGHNLNEIRSLKKKSKYNKLFNLCSKLMLEIVEGRKPVIAKVHGAAFAAGCQLVASCDLAVSRKVSRKKTMKMLLTGDPINAKYAKEIGLINDHYPISELEDEVLKLAKKIASKSNLTIKIGKKAFYKQLEMPLHKAYQYTSEVMTKNAMELDAEEGISAFLEKRKPNWKNK